MPFKARIRIVSTGSEIGVGSNNRIASLKAKVLNDGHGIADGLIQITANDESLLKGLDAGDECMITIAEIK